MNDVEIAATAWLFVLTGVLAWHDLRYFRLPNFWTALLFVSGLAFVLLDRTDRLVDSLLGAAIGALLFLVITSGYLHLRGRAGLGIGDAKLMAGGGVWVGWSGLPMTLLVGTLCALAVTVSLAIVRKERLSAETRIPLGAHLGLGICFTWLLQFIE